MILRSSTENEIALTPTLSQRTGRGGFSIRRAAQRRSALYPRPLCGRGKGEGSVSAKHLISKEHTKLGNLVFQTLGVLCDESIIVMGRSYGRIYGE